MRRREFIAGLGAAIWPLVSRAQPAERVRRIGVLMNLLEGDSEAQARLAAFREGLQALGWTEGRNARTDVRWAGSDYSGNATRFAKELVELRPDVILSTSTTTTAALVEQTRTIPIIMASISDPVGDGFVENLPRPGGNVTGFLNLEASMSNKWLELLKEVAPRVTHVAAVFNPTMAPGGGSYFLGPFMAAARSLGVDAIIAHIHDMSALELAIAAQARTPYGGLIVMPDNFTSAHRVEVTSLAARYGLPAVYPFRPFTEVGGLLSYGNDQRDNFRRAATYIDRILKGEKPGNLPVQAPVKFELVVNAKTAKTLGLELPPSFYWRADEVIE